jgi:hypothetical protein
LQRRLNARPPRSRFVMPLIPGKEPVAMRRVVLLGPVLLLAGPLLTGCVPPTGNAMYRGTTEPPPIAVVVPRSGAATSSVTPPAVGYGSTMPSIPSGGLGAEAPMPAPKATRMPTIAPPVTAASQPTPPSSGQTITVPNGNGTSTIIHPDGTTETVPTPK